MFLNTILSTQRVKIDVIINNTSIKIGPKFGHTCNYFFNYPKKALNLTIQNEWEPCIVIIVDESKPRTVRGAAVTRVR